MLVEAAGIVTIQKANVLENVVIGKKVKANLSVYQKLERHH